jgi:thioester reductase-like protein
MYEYISDNGGDFTPLVSLKLLQPGGAALSESIVQSLTSNGVNVKTTYGSTEIGPPLRSIPHTGDNPRCYAFRNLYPDNPFLKMEEVGEGLYECVVYKGFELAAELWEGKSEDEPYRTNDLFIQDPPGSGFFVLQGRKDDILVHSNGENTSAGPLQLDIQSSSKLISRALALGHSKPCISLLVEVHELYDSQSVLIRNKIWEAVKKVNARYPSHSQVMESMIHILPKGMTLPVTPKGNVKRKEAEKLYAPAITHLYSTLLNPSSFQNSVTIQPPLLEFLRSLFSSLSGHPKTEIKDWTTIYDLGIDSRLALSLRSRLSTQLGEPISLSTIFENPSISQLYSFLNSTPASPTIDKEMQPSSTETTNRIISTLSAELKSWPSHPLNKSHQAASTETILLTGASGSLGTALLQALSATPSVLKIYALIRGPNPSQRLHTSLLNRKIDTAILSSPTSKITILNYCMEDPLLGLDIDTYHLLSHTVTTVVHNAWKMDFNIPLSSFLPDCLRSTMNLLRFCVAGRAKCLAFTSSVSTCHGPGFKGRVVPEEPVGSDPEAAMGTGYAQSKYVIERLTQTGARELGVKVKILRAGQLCGSRQTGVWSEKEMWPILFATSAHPLMNCVPDFPRKDVDWIPVDVAAEAVAELLLRPAAAHGAGEMVPVGTYEVHNIVNPHPITWSSLTSMLQNSIASGGLKTHKMEEIPFSIWVSRLSLLADDGVSPTEVPGLKLLHFFENMVKEGEDGGGEGKDGGRVFETTKSRALSKALRECGTFCQEWVDGNVKGWKEGGFIK